MQMLIKRHYFVTIKLYGFDALAKELIEIAEIKKVIEKSKEKILTYEQFTDTVDFVLLNIKSENYRTGNTSDRSLCVVETICAREGDGLLTFATDTVVSSLKNLFSGKGVLFLVHRH